MPDDTLTFLQVLNSLSLSLLPYEDNNNQNLTIQHFILIHHILISTLSEPPHSSISSLHTLKKNCFLENIYNTGYLHDHRLTGTLRTSDEAFLVYFCWPEAIWEFSYSVRGREGRERQEWWLIGFSCLQRTSIVGFSGKIHLVTNAASMTDH